MNKARIYNVCEPSKYVNLVTTEGSITCQLQPLVLIHFLWPGIKSIHINYCQITSTTMDFLKINKIAVFFCENKVLVLIDVYFRTR